MAVSPEVKEAMEALGAVVMDPETLFSVECVVCMHTKEGRIERFRKTGAMIGPYLLAREVIDMVEELEDDIEQTINNAAGIKRVKAKRPPRAA